MHENLCFYKRRKCHLHCVALAKIPRFRFFRVLVLIDSSSLLFVVCGTLAIKTIFCTKKKLNVQSQSKHLDSAFFVRLCFGFFFFKCKNKIQNSFIISILNGSIIFSTIFLSSLQHLRLSINLISNSVYFFHLFLSQGQNSSMFDFGSEEHKCG